MRLISLTIDGRYKGLVNQSFDFSKSTHGSVIAFIGLNGSGKSQLLELIAEIFALLERIKRPDFKVRTGLPEGIKKLSLYYEINDTGIEIDLLNQGKKIQCIVNGQDYDKYRENVFRHDGQVLHNGSRRYGGGDPLILPDYVIGYASGLHENLQRPFLKNIVQFFDVSRIQMNYYFEYKSAQEAQGNFLIGTTDLEEQAKYIKDVNRRYYTRYSGMGLFGISDDGRYLQEKIEKCIEEGKEGDVPFLQEELDTMQLTTKSARLSNMVTMDYDTNSLLLLGLSILPENLITDLFTITNFKLYFNVKKLPLIDIIDDIKLLIRLSGECVEGIGRRSTDEEYELHELDFYEGYIHFDLTDESVIEQLRSQNYDQAVRLFNRLLRIQLLGVKNWSGLRPNLRKDDFIGTLKKPLKTKLPLMVYNLGLKNSHGKEVCYDDLSDGEVQFITILAAIRIFSDDNRNVLFLLDEPETHLNPAWRTYYNEYIERAIVSPINTQILMTTHSPFLISSLRKGQVYTFEKRENDIVMHPSESETFGASFDVLIKRYFGLKSSISQTAVTKIKEYLRDGSEEGKVKAKEWINKYLGDSVEKAYLLSKLRASNKTEER